MREREDFIDIFFVVAQNVQLVSVSKIPPVSVHLKHVVLPSNPKVANTESDMSQ